MILLAIALAGVFGRRWAAHAARELAKRRLSVWAVDDAQQWLAWAAWLDPSDGQASLLRASCFRRLQQSDRWSAAIEDAKRNHAPQHLVQQEDRLFRIQSGQIDSQAEQHLGDLIESGAAFNDVLTAFLVGYHLRGENAKLALLLDMWSAESPHDPQLHYAKGLRRKWLGEYRQARASFETALSSAPHHSLARSALAEMDEDRGRLDSALDRYADWLNRSPGDQAARLGMARVLRKMARIEQARQLLAPLLAEREPGSRVVLAQMQTEVDDGRYAEARALLDQLPLDHSTDYEMISAAAFAFALDQQTLPAQDTVAREMITRSSAVRSLDLQVRLMLDPADSVAAAELRRLIESRVTGDVDVSEIAKLMGTARSQNTATPAAELWAEHCNACHGANGDGRGRAARHCFPLPRDVRVDAFRLVGTENSVPTLDDVIAVLRLGMPGTAMRSFENLSDADLRALADEVMRLHREGIRESYIAALEAAGEEVDASEVQDVVEMATTPGRLLPVPQIGPGGPQAIARGGALYLDLGCQHCHGKSGVGAPDMPLFDAGGLPTRARDLVHEPFKGGREPSSVYLRIAAGMPGTPHPATWAVSSEERVDLVHFCLSLAEPVERTLTNHQRMRLATGQAYCRQFAQTDQRPQTQNPSETD